MIRSYGTPGSLFAQQSIISSRSVESHMSNIYKYLNCTSVGHFSNRPPPVNGPQTGHSSAVTCVVRMCGTQVQAAGCVRCCPTGAGLSRQTLACWQPLISLRLRLPLIPLHLRWPVTPQCQVPSHVGFLLSSWNVAAKFEGFDRCSRQCLMPLYLLNRKKSFMTRMFDLARYYRVMGLQSTFSPLVLSLGVKSNSPDPSLGASLSVEA